MSLDQFGNYEWCWNGKKIKLKDLHDDQLDHLKIVLKKFKGECSGRSVKEWITAVETVSYSRSFAKNRELTKILQIKRQQKVSKAVDYFLNHLNTRRGGTNFNFSLEQQNKARNSSK